VGRRRSSPHRALPRRAGERADAARVRHRRRDPGFHHQRHSGLRDGERACQGGAPARTVGFSGHPRKPAEVSAHVLQSRDERRRCHARSQSRHPQHQRCHQRRAGRPPCGRQRLRHDSPEEAGATHGQGDAGRRAPVPGLRLRETDDFGIRGEALDRKRAGQGNDHRGELPLSGRKDHDIHSASEPGRVRPAVGRRSFAAARGGGRLRPECRDDAPDRGPACFDCGGGGPRSHRSDPRPGRQAQPVRSDRLRGLRGIGGGVPRQRLFPRGHRRRPRGFLQPQTVRARLEHHSRRPGAHALRVGRTGPRGRG